MAGLEIIQNDTSTDHFTKTDDGPGEGNNGDLVSWVMERVGAWEDYRETNYRSLWGEYYRLWRGKWDKKDKNRDSERSRIISPALSQAIEATVDDPSHRGDVVPIGEVVQIVG